MFNINRTGIMSMGCPKDPCREKQPIPQVKIYKQRTAEFGVYIDKPLYDEMAVSINEKDFVT